MYKGVIYKITNLVTNKIYIGKTTKDPDEYWHYHKIRANGGYVNKYLYSSMNKHGVENFTFKVIEEIEDISIDKLNSQLNALEQHHISSLGSKVPDGYNLTDGGEGTLGMVFSKEHRENISKSCKGRRSPRKGATLSEKTKEKLSKVRMGRFKGEDNHFYGKKHTEETKKIIKDKNTEYQNRPEIKRQNKLKQPHRISVGMYSLSGELLMTFISLTDAKRWIAKNTEYKGDVGTLSKAVSKGNVSYGYKWKKLDK